MPRSTNRWPMTAAMIAMLFVPIVIVIVVGVAIGTQDSNARTTPATTVLQSDAPRSVDVASEPVTRPVLDPVERPDSHQVMLEQMRVNVTPQMVQTMNANPLTRTPEDLAEVERQAADIDRMLARQP